MASDPADDELFDDPTGAPLAVRLAAAVWVAYGAWCLLVPVAVTTLVLVTKKDLGCFWVMSFGVGFAGRWFIWMGRNTARGAVTDLYQPALWSLGGGAIHTLLTSVLVYSAIVTDESGWVSVALISVVEPPGAVLLVAGTLAFRGNGRYHSWRSAHDDEPRPSGSELDAP